MVGPTASNGVQSTRKAKDNSNLKLSCFIAGIVGSLVMYGILQERIMSEPFGDQEEQFKFSLLLVLANRMLTFSVALLFILVQKQEMRPKAPLYSYAAVSASNVLATTCQYEALKHVTLPVQTLGKCAKMIPVMVWGVLILRKSYSTKDYSRALLVTAGCTIFLMSGEVSAKQAEGSHSNLWGVILMTGYLACDGFTSTFQSRLFKGYKMTVYNQILYTTLFSAAYSFLGLWTSGQLSEALRFLRRHPKVLGHITLLSASSTSGQLFIVHTIQSFGPLLFATVMTSRQFVTILLSCVIFHHPLSKRQWLGTLAVFAAILNKVLEKKKPGPQLSRVGFSEAKLVHGGIAGRAHRESK